MVSLITKQCSFCKKEFTCGSNQAGHSCWCITLPAIMPAEFDQDCRCPACLAQAITKRIKVSIQANGTAEMVEVARPYFNPDHLIEHIDYTIEHDNYIFSSWYHLKRGNCCNYGCRHCPYKNTGNK